MLAGFGAAADCLGSGGGVTAGVVSTAGLEGRVEAEEGRLDRGKYLSSKSARSAITVFLVVGL